jgi:hypothetical protein
MIDNFIAWAYDRHLGYRNFDARWQEAEIMHGGDYEICDDIWCRLARIVERIFRSWYLDD